MRCSARPSACRRAQAGLFHQDQSRSKPASFSTRRSRPIRRWQRIVWPRAKRGRRRTVPMPTRNASRTLSCSATARGPWSGNTKRARWSMAAMSASSGPTMNILAARIPTVRPTRSCGTGQRANASASVRSSPKQPTTARRMKAMRQGVIASLDGREKEARRGRHRTPAPSKRIEPKLLKIGAGLAGAIDRARQELRPDLPLLTLRGRLLCRRRVCRLRAVGDVEAISDAGRRQDFRRRAAEGRRRPAAMTAAPHVRTPA